MDNNSLNAVRSRDCFIENNVKAICSPLNQINFSSPNKRWMENINIMTAKDVKLENLLKIKLLLGESSNIFL